MPAADPDSEQPAKNHIMSGHPSVFTVPAVFHFNSFSFLCISAPTHSAPVISCPPRCSRCSASALLCYALPLLLYVVPGKSIPLHLRADQSPGLSSRHFAHPFLCDAHHCPCASPPRLSIAQLLDAFKANPGRSTASLCHFNALLTVPGLAIAELIAASPQRFVFLHFHSGSSHAGAHPSQSGSRRSEATPFLFASVPIVAMPLPFASVPLDALPWRLLAPQSFSLAVQFQSFISSPLLFGSTQGLAIAGKGMITPPAPPAPRR